MIYVLENKSLNALLEEVNKQEEEKIGYCIGAITNYLIRDYVNNINVYMFIATMREGIKEDGF